MFLVSNSQLGIHGGHITKVVWPLFILLFVLTSPSFSMTSETEEVAKVLAAEGCSEGEYGIWRIGNVVANRARHRDLTPYQVVTQPKQFSGYTSKNKNELYLQCKEIADEIAKNIMNIKDLTRGATHFENTNAFGKPYWASHMIMTSHYKNHTFYKERTWQQQSKHRGKN